MRNIVLTSLCAAIVACAGVVIAAQTTTTTPQTITPSAPSPEQKIAVTGCLKEAPSSSTTAGAAAGPTYILTNATTAPVDASSATSTTGAIGTTGTTGSTATTATAGAVATTGSAPAASGETYQLIANASALTPHVGKKLELTGVLESAATGNSESTTGADAKANSPTLRVQSGKIVAASCTP